MVSRYGIDFGTTNSALAICDADGVRVVSINNTDSGEKTLRSALLFGTDRKIYFGQEALAKVAGARQVVGRFMQSFKAYLPDSTFTGTTIDGKPHFIEDIVAIFLRYIKERGDQASGQNITSVILGRPVLFSDNEERDALAETRLRKAAGAAGFVDIAFEFEPVAAVLAYATITRDQRERTVLMGDFGGGTSDFTVMRLTPGKAMTQDEKRQSVLAVGGVYVGGDIFDGRVMWGKVTPHFGRNLTFRGETGADMPMPVWIMRSLCELRRIPFLHEMGALRICREIKARTSQPELVTNLEHLIVENLGHAVFRAIETAKRELSNVSSSQVMFDIDEEEILEAISRTDFEGLIRADVERVEACATETLAKAEIGADQVDSVLLTGGSSFIPFIRDIFIRTFGAERVVTLDAFTSVAHGLGVVAGMPT